MLKNWVAGSNTQTDTQSTNPRTKTLQALTDSKWVGGHYVLSACCMPCLPSLRPLSSLEGLLEDLQALASTQHIVGHLSECLFFSANGNQGQAEGVVSERHLVAHVECCQGFGRHSAQQQRDCDILCDWVDHTPAHSPTLPAVPRPLPVARSGAVLKQQLDLLENSEVRTLGFHLSRGRDFRKLAFGATELDHGYRRPILGCNQLFFSTTIGSNRFFKKNNRKLSIVFKANQFQSLHWRYGMAYGMAYGVQYVFVVSTA